MKYTIKDNFGRIIVILRNSFESREVTFFAEDIASITRNWGDVTVTFCDGTKKVFELTWRSDAERFENDLHQVVNPYRRRSRSVIVEDRRKINNDSDIITAGIFGVITILSLAGAVIWEKISQKEEKNNKYRPPGGVI